MPAASHGAQVLLHTSTKDVPVHTLVDLRLGDQCAQPPCSLSGPDGAASMPRELPKGDCACPWRTGGDHHRARAVDHKGIRAWEGEKLDTA